MKTKYILIGILIFTNLIAFAPKAEAVSMKRHLCNAGENLGKMVFAPFKGVFITAPRNIKNAYIYEAYQREKPKKNSKLRGIWRAPGELVKGALDGIVETVDYGRKTFWEIISIPFGD